MRVVRVCGMIVCFVGVCVCGYRIMRWRVESDIAKEQIIIVQDTELKEITTDDPEKTQIIESPDEPEENPYWDFIKKSMLDVDFAELKNNNPNTIGWLKVEGTNINYPFVQSKDNDFYLKHTFNRSWNAAGWVFLDYRNSQKLLENRNTILYAHGRYDGSMFGTLKNALSSQWYEDLNNHVIKISTPTENTLWQVFSVYRIPTTNDYIKTDFDSNNEFLTFAKILKKRSAFEFYTAINKDDRIITLSTCVGVNNSERMVVHAKLIKVSDKV